MPKFKVGDKIEFEMDGKKVSGTITRDYNSPDHAMYDVRVGTKTMTIADTPMHPANSRAATNAKFKVGDKVRVKGWQGIWEVTKTPPGMLEVKSDDGFVGITQVEKATPVKGANACRNASFKVGDKVTYWVFDKKLNGSVKAVRGERVDIDDGHGGVVTFKAKDLEVWNAKACKNAKFIKGDFVKVKGWPGTFRIDIVNPDGTYVLKKYPSGQPTIGSYKESELELEEANAKACNSRNPIVAKALNACARNGKFSEYPHFLWLAPWSDKAIMAGEKYQRTAQDLLWDGANLLRGKTKAVVQKAYDALRKAGIPDEELNVGYKPISNACARNGIDDLNFDMKGVYETARKLLKAGAKHLTGYKWSIPGDMEYGANIIASKVGGGVKRIQPDPNKAGFVIAEITDPLAQALERKGVMNACGTARNATPEASIRSEFNRLVREADRFKADKDALKKREMQLEKQFDQLQKDAERSKLDALAFEIFGKSTDYFA